MSDHLKNSKKDFLYLPMLVGDRSIIDYGTIAKYSSKTEPT